jgi:hypothetical protein
MAENTFFIYSHADADGGIAASIFLRHLQICHPDWKGQVVPVNHGQGQGEWTLKEIHWPCAILDFTLHPALFSSRFLTKRDQFVAKNPQAIPPTPYWIDHHPTGSSYQFLNSKNLPEFLPGVKCKWDISAISTPGLFRTHHEELGFSRALIEEYEGYIDLAEIIDGALFVDAEAAHDFQSLPVKLQTLFNPSHPSIDKNKNYKRLVEFISKNSNPADIFSCDPIFKAIVLYEEKMFSRQLSSYRIVAKKIGNTAVAHFKEGMPYEGLGRFLPYMIFPDAQYGLHVLPKQKGFCSVTCGINPWNKPKSDEKHLGNFFAKNFSGGGHSFVAGGKIAENDTESVNKIINFINEN